jgi:hypothetical protein
MAKLDLKNCFLKLPYITILLYTSVFLIVLVISISSSVHVTLHFHQKTLQNVLTYKHQ